MLDQMDQKQAIKGAIKDRLVAQRNFLAFCKHTDRKYPADARHIQLMTQKLEQVKLYLKTNGKQGIGRLMIFMPPRYWKSQTASRKFPAFVMGDMPDTRIILTSYGADLATKHSREVRDIIQSEEYSQVFGELASTSEPILLDPESRSAAAWELAGHHGGMLASGVGGAITGFGAKLFIIDDPVKNREDAASAQRRDSIYEWYQSTAFTRLEDFAAIILILTRWHQMDLAGKLLRAMATDAEADQWDVLCMPAIALEEKQYPKTLEEFFDNLANGIFIPLNGDPLGRKPGEPLWPEKHDRDALKSIGANIGEFELTAQYQQMPYSKEGQRYKKEWFKKIAKLPEDVKIVFAVRFWDKANSIAGDYTAGVLMAYCSDGFFYMLDVKRKQAASYERDQMMKKAAKDDREKYGNVKIWHQQDPGSAGKDSAEGTNRVLMGFNAKFETVSGDKTVRSEPLESAFEGGLVFLLMGAWNEDYIDECVAFDRGANDDQVDAGSSCYNKLLEMIGKKRESRIL